VIRPNRVPIVCLGLAIGALWVFAAPDRGYAQETGLAIRVELGVNPESVTVGQPFDSSVRVVPPQGYRVEYPPFVDTDSLHATREPALVSGRDSLVAAVYPMVAWIAGAPLTATITARLIAPDASTLPAQIRLQLPEVVSVLPAEGVEVVPMPPKGFVESSLLTSMPWWWWLLIALGALISGLGGYWLLRRRGSFDSELPRDPRAWALAQLGQRGVGALLVANDLGGLFDRVGWVVRAYVQEVYPELGLDLTSTELVARLEALGPPASLGATALARLLLQTDSVKFARYRPNADEGLAILDEARGWVVGFPAASVDEETRSAA